MLQGGEREKEVGREGQEVQDVREQKFRAEDLSSVPEDLTVNVGRETKPSAMCLQI